MKESAYVTDYFYFSVRQEKQDGQDFLVYCSGVNLDRFLPMMRGRLGLGSNPVTSGLQLVKYELCSLALAKGAVPKTQPGLARCADITLCDGAWYGESLLIEKSAGLLPEEIVEFCVDRYIKRVAAFSLQECDLPQALPSPVDMQVRMDTLCKAA